MTKRRSVRILSLLMAVLMLSSSYIFAVSAVDVVEVEEGNCTYRIADQTSLYSCEETARGTVTILSSIMDNTVRIIDNYAFYGCTMVTAVIIPTTVQSIGNYSFAFCTSLTTVEIPSSVTYIGDNAFIRSDIASIRCEKDSTAYRYAKEHGIPTTELNNVYNLGDETYRFENYSDADSPGGHCFGMAVTSSGYYWGSLSKRIIGGEDQNSLYSFSDTWIVKQPICHYIHIQGPGSEYESMVAGGSIDLTDIRNTRSDWEQCVQYVKNHDYDHKGNLNVGMWYNGGGGHAVNFLYYANVRGQDRIYVYDNNIPDEETYYYMGDDGLIYQAPQRTSSAGIIGLDLMDVNLYFTYVPKFQLNKYVYADKKEISIPGTKMYYMKCGYDRSTSVMYEMPEGTSRITIKPLTDYATFTYLDKTYRFGDIDEDTVGVLTLAEDDSGVVAEPELTIINEPADDVSIDIKGYKKDRLVDYRSTITLSAVPSKTVPDAQTLWFIDGKEYCEGDQCTVKEVKKSFSVQAKYVKSGKQLAESEIETIRVKTGFFAKLKAFFRALFGKLPRIVQERLFENTSEKR